MSDDKFAYLRRKVRRNLAVAALYPYTRLRIHQVRHKDVIDVLYIINNLGAWKSELLYQAMLKHPRFNPILLVTPSLEEDNCAEIISYMDAHGYKYEYERDIHNLNLQKRYRPDIIFYQKPYRHCLPSIMRPGQNRRSLLCYVNYGFHGLDLPWLRNALTLSYSWQIYYENEVAMKSGAEVMYNGGRNLVLTGLPVQDQLLMPKEHYRDPWRSQDVAKKRIIFAPHHSITPQDLMGGDTFMRFADFMLEMARKYADKVQWAFKPHQLLRRKLEENWGKQRTDAYYAAWSEMENSQYENGDYLALFHHSDAMIHNCGSFTIEYHATKNPVMYLCKEGYDYKGKHNDFHMEAFDLHAKAYDHADVERFIQSVISGEDPNRAAREDFYTRCMRTPNGRTACENIIAAILGEN